MFSGIIIAISAGMLTDSVSTFGPHLMFDSYKRTKTKSKNCQHDANLPGVQ